MSEKDKITLEDFSIDWEELLVACMNDDEKEKCFRHTLMDMAFHICKTYEINNQNQLNHLIYQFNKLKNNYVEYFIEEHDLEVGDYTEPSSVKIEDHFSNIIFS